MERIVAVCGVAVTVLIAGIFFYLVSESRYAFDQKFGFGMRFAAQDPGSIDDDLAFDPNATLLAAHPDGRDGLDDKDAAVPAVTIADLAGVATAATAVAFESEPAGLYRDDWRAMRSAGDRVSYGFYAFATPEHKAQALRLRWGPDASFEPEYSPFRLRLRLVSAPQGISAPPVDIDLSRNPSGYVDLPVAIARTDADRTKVYKFEMLAEPTYSNAVTATLAGLFRTQWAPTSQYPRFGFMPLLFGTLLVTLLAMVFATLPSIFAAIYLSEIAPPRLREWLKPVIELLSSVPTVVLGYFGLMVVAPGLMATVGAGLHMESGRSLLTAAIMMAVLVMPVIVSVAEDALRSLPDTLRDSATGLGLTPAESLKKVLLPAGRAGLAGAVLLGFARAIGETMIVWILSGGTALMPSGVKSLVGPSRGIADTIGIEMANVEFERPHYGHLFLIGVALFLMTVGINWLGHRFARRNAWQA